MPRSLAILTLLLLFYFPAKAQNPKIDSLILKAENPALPDSVRISALINISELSKDTALGFASRYSSRALELAKKSGNKAWKSRALDSHATLLKFIGDFEESEKLYLDAKAILESQPDSNMLALVYSHLGTLYQAKQQNQLAIYYLLRSQAIDKVLQTDTKRVAATYNNLGNVYYTDKNYHRAKEFYFKALSINIPSKYQRWEAINYLNLGNVYKDLLATDSGVYYYRKGIELANKLNVVWISAACKEGLGLCLLKQGKADEALSVFQSALEEARSFGNKEIEFSVQAGLAYALLDLGRVKEARINYEHCVDSAGNYNFSLLRAQLYLLGAVICEKERNFEEANRLYKRYSELRDSSAALQNESMYRDFENRLLQEQEQHEKEIVRRQEEEKKVQEIKRNRIILVAVIMILVLSVALGLIAYRNFRVKKKNADELAEQKHIIEEKQKEILDSISYAKRLQDAILPRQSTISRYLASSFLLYKPKDIVAGDFYWFEHVGDTSFIAAADCTGHGVPGAMVSVVCSAALNRAVLEFGLRKPGEILDKTRELVLETFAKSDEEVKDGMDISICAMQGKNISWAGANNPLWYISGGALHEIKADKQPIGKSDQPRPFTTHTLQLHDGDEVFLFTDGYADQFGGPKGKKFKYKQLGEKLVEIAGLSLQEQKDILDKTFESWRGNIEQVDDVCVIGIRV